VAKITGTDFWSNEVSSVNEYFDGQVVSISFQGEQLPASVGVMKPGEYTFDTRQKETMTVVSGVLTVQLPGEGGWTDYRAGEHFIVAAGAAFRLKVASDAAYLCTYE